MKITEYNKHYIVEFLNFHMYILKSQNFYITLGELLWQNSRFMNKQIWEIFL